jgi:hypothetical protein
LAASSKIAHRLEQNNPENQAETCKKEVDKALKVAAVRIWWYRSRTDETE